jgi:hypothetical protein
MAPRSQAGRIEWPLTADQVELMDKMFQELYDDVRNDAFFPSTTEGDLLFRNSAALTRLGIGGANTVLRTGGTTPEWAKVGLTADVSGVLPVANGGSGRASATAYAVIAGGTTSTGAHQSVASVGTAGQVLTSNGAGALPTFQTLAGGMTYVLAASDESVADDTLQDDDELLFSVAANSVYYIEVIAWFTTGTSATPDVKTFWTYPAAATLTETRDAYIVGATVVTEATLRTNRYQLASGSGVAVAGGVISTAQTGASPILLRAILRTGANAGTMQFQWAQNTSTGGTPTVRKADSFLRYQKIA